jgi:transposase
MRKNQQAVEEARRTGRVREAAARHGVSLRTVYRSLKKKT